MVVVEEKIKAPDAVPAGRLIPDAIDGVPTDVTPATPSDQLRWSETRAFPIDSVSSLDELIAPGERSKVVPDTEGTERALIQYHPPDGVSLEPIDDQMTVTCHLSPDIGWPILSDFLEGVKESLTVAMYDFSAPHILKQLRQQLRPVPRTLELVLDPALSLSNGGGSDNPKAKDVDEGIVVDVLRAALGGKRFKFTWAAVKRKGKVSQGIFPKSYHIKVAGRGRRGFWLSSGNWQSSNQPPEEVVPRDMDADIDLPLIWTKYNREWHVVVEHQGLAETLAPTSTPTSNRPSRSRPRSAARPRGGQNPGCWSRSTRARRPREVKRIKPLVLNRSVKVLPVFTPDNYAENVLPLVRSARSTLYFQNQYIAIAKEIPQAFSDLLDALLDRARARGRLQDDPPRHRRRADHARSSGGPRLRPRRTGEDTEIDAHQGHHRRHSAGPRRQPQLVGRDDQEPRRQLVVRRRRDRSLL